ncbi:hypothetical protein NM688_g6932 [Phlebia brevispora]|uniref:Uncharacterized protein n=1 Tax=Phlebia brevispora TaxID=194682 RepID=A0ACC1SAU3_9APHY|nr:hypothetical protein NM688_g6932 [Phlebia brevispora]
MLGPNGAQPATYPGVRFLKITMLADDPLPVFPWPFIVRSVDYTMPVTVADVVFHIRSNFRQKMHDHELYALKAERKDILDRAFYTRIGSMETEEVYRASLRVDYLGSNYVFRGLELSPDGEGFMLFVGPPYGPSTPRSRFAPDFNIAMAAERVIEQPFVDADDDDMPPLVEPPSVTFTFATNMTPDMYSMGPAGFESTPVNDVVQSSYPLSPEPIFASFEARTSHTKKKDANHIPRPPNAFILFRSSFIKAQHIPEKIEGNHSALSKIIGKYWRTLPPQEKEKWEAKAIVALAEHRKKYPDWRFRPGANVLSKVKDGPRRRNNRKGRGEVEKDVKIRSKRCDKIADLLVAGKTGMDLEAAIQQYDCETGGGPKADDEDGCGVLVMKIENPAGLSQTTNLRGESAVTRITATVGGQRADASVAGTRPADCRSSMQGPAADARFDTPLTSMFKRSSSAPAAPDRPWSAQSLSPSPQIFTRRDSLSAIPPTNFSDSILASSQELHAHSDARVEHDIAVTPNQCTTRGDSVDSLLLCQSPSLSLASSPGYDSPATRPQWFDVYIENEASRYTPTLPAFIPDIDSPVSSPPAFPLEFNSEGEQGTMAVVDNSSATSCLGAPTSAQSYSSYSSLEGWDGVMSYPTKCMSGVYNPVTSPFVVTQLSPAEYDHDSVMKDALEAASYAQLEGYGMGYTSEHTIARQLSNTHIGLKLGITSKSSPSAYVKFFSPPALSRLLDDKSNQILSLEVVSFYSALLANPAVTLAQWENVVPRIDIGLNCTTSLEISPSSKCLRLDPRTVMPMLLPRFLCCC